MGEIVGPVVAVLVVIIVIVVIVAAVVYYRKRQRCIIYKGKPTQILEPDFTESVGWTQLHVITHYN